MSETPCLACAGPARPRGDGVARCRRCGTWLRNRPTDESLASLYRTAWRRPENGRELTGGTSRALALQLADRLRLDLALPSWAGTRALEVGAGNGELSRVLADAGADIVAMDPYSGGLLAGTGIPAVASWSELDAGYRVDGIVAIEVIEHTTDPSTFLASCARFLRPGGWLFLTTPNAAGLHARLARTRWRELRNPGHLQLFTPEGLERLLRDAGLGSVRRLRWDLDYGVGTIRREVQRVLQRTGTGGSLQALAWKP